MTQTATKTRKSTAKQATEKNAVENILSVHLWGNVALYRVRANAPLTEKAYASIQANKEQSKEHGEIYTGNEVIEPQEGVFFEVYQTVFVDGLAKSCSCPSKRPCYHELQLAPVEQEQAAKRRARRYEREQLARERTEFPYGLNVPAWAGMFGTIISDVFVNSEGIHGVEVLLEDGETRLVSIQTLRFEQEDQEKREAGLVQAPNGNWLTPAQLANVPGAVVVEEDRDESNEEAKLDRWANEEIIVHAAQPAIERSSMGKRGGLLIPPPVEAPTPHKMSEDWLLGRRAS